MTSWRQWLVNPPALWLLAVLPILILLAWNAARLRRRALRRFGHPWPLHARLNAAALTWLGRTCSALGLIFLIAGIAGPRWGRDSGQALAPSRDLVVVLDVSRSMLAQDVLPSRVERAKQALEDLSIRLQQRGGYRLALIAFAARPYLVCPLTYDYGHFRFALATLDAADPPRAIRPLTEDASSGTRIGAALRLAVETLDARERGFQDILLLSDGDDPAGDKEWREGAQEARREGIPVHAIGIGDPTRDSPIMLKPGTSLNYRGAPVQTRLREEPLAAIAEATHGTYTPARTQALPLGELFSQRIASQTMRGSDEDSPPLYRLQYVWFLGPALALLALEMMLCGIGKRT